MGVPARILERIQLFERNKDYYLKQGYNEAQVREEFVNPFFEELGI